MFNSSTRISAAGIRYEFITKYFKQGIENIAG